MLSEQLLIDRSGNFTASENHRLMAGWDTTKPNTDFAEYDELVAFMRPEFHKGVTKFLVGDLKDVFDFKVTGKMISDTLAAIKYEIPPTGLVTYAQEKAIETLFDPDPSLQFSTVHTANGEEREADCMYLLAEKTKLNFVNIGEQQVHIHTDQVGCTPDGVVLNELDLVETGAEVKCKSALVHARNLLINNNQDMIEGAFDHFVQLQTPMLITGADHWYFANYNPFAKKASLMFKYIVIERDNDFIAILNERLTLAKKIKAEFLNELLESVEEKPDTKTLSDQSKLSIEI